MPCPKSSNLARTRVYVILGATHPNLVRQQGEAYRDSLTARARSLGIEDHVVFFNQFVDQATLLDFISMCDVYVTPYLNEAQMTSGTLAYSFGLGKAVVSTPYWHAKELLSDGCGILVPFGDAKALGAEISGLLTNDVRRHCHAQARLCGEPIDDLGANSQALSDGLRDRERECPAREIAFPSKPSAPAEKRTRHTGNSDRAFPFALRRHRHDPTCGPFGSRIAPTATASTTTRARCCSQACCRTSAKRRLSNSITARFAAFIQHAWNPDTRRFRNFMSYDRRWLEEQGSEDSHGRTLWALAECARRDA